LATDPAAGFCEFLAGLDFEKADAIVRARVPQKWRERIAAEDTLAGRLTAPEGLRWLDAAREAYNAASATLQRLRVRDSADYMAFAALTREVTLALHARHVASDAEFKTLTLPVRGFFDLGG
jgi:hypothetical protein